MPATADLPILICCWLVTLYGVWKPGSFPVLGWGIRRDRREILAAGLVVTLVYLFLDDVLVSQIVGHLPAAGP